MKRVLRKFYYIYFILIGLYSCISSYTATDVSKPTFTCTDLTKSADGTCKFSVPNYADGDMIPVSDNCGVSSITQSTTLKNTQVGLGQHTVGISALGILTPFIVFWFFNLEYRC